jgi:hypothetical protein
LGQAIDLAFGLLTHLGDFAISRRGDVRLFGLSFRLRSLNNLGLLRAQPDELCFRRRQLRKGGLFLFLSFDQFRSDRFTLCFELFAERLFQDVDHEGDEDREVDKLPELESPDVEPRVVKPRGAGFGSVRAFSGEEQEIVEKSKHIGLGLQNIRADLFRHHYRFIGDDATGLGGFLFKFLLTGR